MPGRIWRFEIERGSAGNVLVLSISGRIGSAAAPAFREALHRAIQTSPAVVVDLTGVDYVSGPGLAALQSAAAANGSVVLCGVSGPVQIALELAGLAGELPIEPTRDAAAGRLRESSRPPSGFIFEP